MSTRPTYSMLKTLSRFIPGPTVATLISIVGEQRMSLISSALVVEADNRYDIITFPSGRTEICIFQYLHSTGNEAFVTRYCLGATLEAS